MSYSSQLSGNLDKIFNKYGNQFRFRYFTSGYAGGGSYYDDKIVLTVSGTDIYCSGMMQPLNNNKGSFDSVLMEAGRLLQDDKVLFLNGSINTSGTDVIFKIGMGSPTTREFGIVSEGIVSHSLQGTQIYKKLYIRNLLTGSLIGE